MTNAESRRPAILVVDDDDSVRHGVARALREEGYEVATAADGQDALDMAAVRSFDLVFLDIMMPGMDGLNVLSLMSARHPGTPVVMLTALQHPESESEAISREAFSYITKPCRLSEIIGTAQDLLGPAWDRNRSSHDGTGTFEPSAFDQHVIDGRDIEPGSGTRSVIVVDDDPRVRENLARALREEGYYVVEAADGETALEEATRRHYDLMFLDIRMPGISGLGVLAKMATDHPETVVVMLTAVTGDFPREVAERNEAFAYIAKPCRLDEVVAVTHAVLRE